MLQSKTIQLLFLVGIILSSAMVSADPEDSWKEKIYSLSPQWRYGFALGASALGVAGIYKLCTGQKSDEVVLREVRCVYDSVYIKYATLIKQMVDKDLLSGPKIPSYPMLRFPHEIVEVWLSKITSLLDNIKLGLLSSDTSRLCAARNELQKRIQWSEKKWQTSSAKKVRLAMIAIKREIENFLPSLELVNGHLREHNSYFALYKKEQELCKKYDRELTLDHESLDREHLKRIITFKQLENKWIYSFAEYVDTLNRDLEVLDELLNRAKEDEGPFPIYSDVISRTQKLYNELKQIQEKIVLDDRYQQEVKDWAHQRSIDAIKERQVRA